MLQLKAFVFLLGIAGVTFVSAVPSLLSGINYQCPANKTVGQYGDCPESCLSLVNPPMSCTYRLNYGCKCLDGFVLKEDREYASDCIKPEDCPPQGIQTFLGRPLNRECPANKTFGEFGDCPTSCRSLIHPPEYCTLKLNIGCKCEQGFVLRDELRIFSSDCIRPEDCPPEPPSLQDIGNQDCPANKTHGMFGDCPTSCHSLVHPPMFCTLRMNYGCKCQEGYVLSEDKNFASDCIKNEDCPPVPEGRSLFTPISNQPCPANKTYGSFTDCPTSCHSISHPPQFCTRKLNFGCMCQQGFVLMEDKNFSSACIQPQDCPAEASLSRAPEDTFRFSSRVRECPANKTHGTFTSCPDSCRTLLPGAEELPCNRRLNVGCKCEEGFVLSVDRNLTSPCIKPEDCPPADRPAIERKCPFNKTEGTFDTCPESCLSISLGEDDYYEACDRSLNFGCMCEEGFILSIDRIHSSPCIKPEDCPSAGRPVVSRKADPDCPANKTHGTFDSCPDSCYSLSLGEDADRLPCDRRLHAGCKCEEGFVLSVDRNFTSSCIKPEDCPPTGSASLLPIPEECPANKTYGTFDDCPTSCHSLRHPPLFCTRKLNVGCMCEDGYVLREDKNFRSDCIKPKDCPSEEPTLHGGIREECPANKTFGSFGDCQTSCLSLVQPHEFCNYRMHFGCMCKEGFVLSEDRNYDSPCIKSEECPPIAIAYAGPSLGGRRQECPANKSFGPFGDCPESCFSLLVPHQVCTLKLNWGCKCDDGFVLKQNIFSSDCVRPDDCPTLVQPSSRAQLWNRDCPANKTFGPFGDCPDSCHSLRHPHEICTMSMNWGCKCLDGYVLRENQVFTSDCVKIEDCPAEETR